MSRMSRCPRPFVLACALLVALVPLVPSGPRGVADADEEVAEFLISQAKKAIAKRDFQEAIEKLQRAREEAPDLPEPSYLLGTVYDKTKDDAGALAAYRAFRDACARVGDDLDSKTKRWLKKAERRLEKLAKGDRELERRTKDFTRDLLALAERWREKDPDLAAETARRVLAVHPRHEAAEALLKALGEGGAPSADAGPPSPVPGITSWHDLLRKEDIPSDNDEKTYADGVLTLNQKEGSIFWTDPAIVGTGTYVYDMEFRFLERYRPGYLVGLAFARDDAADRAGRMECVMAFAQRSSVKLLQASGGKNLDIGDAGMRGQPLGTWQRLTVAVEDRKVRVWLDGKRLLTSTVPGRKSLDGALGLFHQRCKCEIRMLRLGKAE